MGVTHKRSLHTCRNRQAVNADRCHGSRIKCITGRDQISTQVGTICNPATVQLAILSRQCSVADLLNHCLLIVFCPAIVEDCRERSEERRVGREWRVWWGLTERKMECRQV